MNDDKDAIDASDDDDASHIDIDIDYDNEDENEDPLNRFCKVSNSFT